jgi:hypothetical protein
MSLSPQLLRHLFEEHGKNTAAWPQELQDLIDPKIEAVAISAPMSGKVDKFLNTDYHYHFVEFMDGATPKHDRAQGLRFVGWEFATTDDVKMCSESTVMGRNKERKSKDGGPGWSDDIRSGDRRLMKIPMSIWRKIKKAQVLAGYQMAYPQPMGPSGPMKAMDLIPGFKSETMDEAQIAEAQRRFTPENTVVQKTHKQIEQEQKQGL